MSKTRRNTRKNSIPGAITNSTNASLMRDINRLKTGELIELYAYSEAIVETVREPLVILDKYLQVKTANKAFFDTFQVTKQATYNRKIFDLNNGEWNIPALRKLLKDILPKNLHFADFEVHHDFNKLGQKTMVLNARRIILEGHKTELILLAIEDVTNKRESEASLLKKQEQLSIAQHAGKIGAYEWDLVTQQSTWTKEFEALYGFPQGGFTGGEIETWITYVHPDDRKKVLDETTKAIKSKNELTMEFRVVWQDQSVHYLTNRAKIIRDTRGKALRMNGLHIDITERKFIENNLKFLSEASKLLASSLDYKTTLNSVAKLAVPEIADWCGVDIKTDTGIEQVAVAHVDPKKVKWAKELRKKTPINLDDPTGIPEVIRTGKSQFYPDIPDDILVAAAKNAEELALIRKIGFTSVMIAPLRVGKEVIGGISFVSAESGRHYTEADLSMAGELASRAALAIENARLYTEAQQAISLRDDFISIASHELKTPVTSLKMYTQVMQKQLERNGAASFARPLKKIDDQVDKLTVLINDLLNVSKVRHGKLDFTMDSFDLNDLVKETVEAIQATTIHHIIHIKGTVSRKVYGDRYRLYQVITNLLTNAIKYSPKADSVVVIVTPENDAAVVTVQDFGIGIDTAEQKKVFSQFYRVSDPEEKTFPGLGMGLYISHEIVTRHNGTMTVSSTKGKGSQFTFTIPYAE